MSGKANPLQLQVSGRCQYSTRKVYFKEIFLPPRRKRYGVQNQRRYRFFTSLFMGSYQIFMGGQTFFSATAYPFCFKGAEF